MTAKSEKTRQLIIEKAAPLFNGKGYAATSMNDILDAAGITKGCFYGHFESKEAIAAEAFNYSYMQLRKALDIKVAEQESAVGKLKAILQFYRNYTVMPPVAGGCPVLNTAIDADDNIPFLKLIASKALNKMLRALENIFQLGIDKGEFSGQLDKANEASLFFSIIEGGIMMSKLGDNPNILNMLLEQLDGFIMQRYSA